MKPARFTTAGGTLFTVDACDAPLVLSRSSWGRHARGIIDGKTNELLHRLILGLAGRRRLVQFRDGNRYNCQRANLIVTDQSHVASAKANSGTKNLRRTGSIYRIWRSFKSTAGRVHRYPYVACATQVFGTLMRKYIRVRGEDWAAAEAEAREQLNEWQRIIASPESCDATRVIDGAEVRIYDLARGDVEERGQVVVLSEVNAFYQSFLE